MIYQQIQKDWACTHLWFLGRSTASNVQNSQYPLERCWRLLRQASASWMQRDLQCLICGHDSHFSGFFILCFANIPYSCFFCVRPFLNSLFESCERQTSSCKLADLGWVARRASTIMARVMANKGLRSSKILGWNIRLEVDQRQVSLHSYVHLAVQKRWLAPCPTAVLSDFVSGFQEFTSFATRPTSKDVLVYQFITS